MDAQAETGWAKALLVAGVLFLGSGIYAYSELMYLIRGRDVTATITEAHKVTKRGRFGLSRGQQIEVDYRFKDHEGNERTGSDRMDEDWPVPPDRKVEVRYRPGPDGSSRVAGRIGWITLIIFGLGLTTVCVFGIRLWREANDANTKPGRKKDAFRGTMSWDRVREQMVGEETEGRLNERSSIICQVLVRSGCGYRARHIPDVLVLRQLVESGSSLRSDLLRQDSRLVSFVGWSRGSAVCRWTTNWVTPRLDPQTSEEEITRRRSAP